MDFDVGKQWQLASVDVFALEKMLVGVGVDDAWVQVAMEAQRGATLDPAEEFEFEGIGGVEAEPEFVKHDVPRGFFGCDGTQMCGQFVAESAVMVGVRHELQADPVGLEGGEFGAQFFQSSWIGLPLLKKGAGLSRLTRLCAGKADFFGGKLIGGDPWVVEPDEEDGVALFAAVFAESPGVIADAVFSRCQRSADEDELHFRRKF